MKNPILDQALTAILEQYGKSFSQKEFSEESSELDVLMLAFNLTQEIKAENKQYWGRELGMCWQRLVVELCRQTAERFSPPTREGADEMCDLYLGTDAIDTKYRIGSGDSGTLKKFKQYGERLLKSGYKPILLILRDDNLPAAIAACIGGGWTVLTDDESFEYIRQATDFDLRHWLESQQGRFG